jgi:apoptosis-inducing factor 2
MSTEPPAEVPTVVIIGGGYGGVSAAKALDEHAHVILIEPKEAFQHNVAALRALVDPAWPDQIFLPYDKLLAHGTVRQDRAVRVGPHEVELASGERLPADYIVLATGSTYPFPAKSNRIDTAGAVAHYHSMRANLAEAGRVMLVGAGAVGLELAGEIAAAWPDKHIVLVDLAPEILPGPFEPKLRDELNRQLDEFGVERVLGSPLTELPPSAPGEVAAFTVHTAAGTRIDADVWFQCHGVVPVTDYLTEELAVARTGEGYLEVTPQLTVAGFDTVYAVGDVSTADAKKAGAAGRQADVVAANIQAQIAGRPDRVSYELAPVSILLPLGPTGGAGQRAGQDELIPASFVAQIKGGDMLIARYRDIFNLPAPS